MEIDREDVPVVGMLLANYLAESVGAFNRSRGVEVPNGVVLHATAAMFASALAEIIRANPPEIGQQVMRNWMDRIRERVEDELHRKGEDHA